MDPNAHLVPMCLARLDGSHLNTSFDGAFRSVMVLDPPLRKQVFGGPSECTRSYDYTGLSREDAALFQFFSRLTIQMGHKDDMREVFAGEITATGLRLTEYGQRFSVTASSVLYRLDIAKRIRHFEHKTPSEMIKTILDEYNLQADIDRFGREKAFWESEEKTDLEFILELAGTYGKDLYCRDKKVYVKNQMMMQRDEIIYERGKNLIEFRVTENTNGQPGAIRYMGWDTNKREGFRVVKKLSEIDWKVGGGKDWTKLYKGGENRIDTVMDFGVRDRAEAGELALGMLQKRSYGYIRAEGSGEGNPALMAGMRVEVKQVGRPCSGEYIAENVTHRLDADEGYITEFRLKRNTVEESFGKRNTAVDRYADEAFRQKTAEAETQVQTKEKEEEQEGPEYRSLKWKKDGKEISEALVDDVVAITFEVKNIPDGETVKITIWESDEGEENPDDKIEVVEGKVVKGAVTVDWKVEYHADDDDTNSAKELEEKGYTLPEYYFVAEYNGVESEQGKLLYVKGWAEVPIDKMNLPSGAKVLLRLPDGTTKEPDAANKNSIVDGVPLGYAEIIIVWE